MEGGGQLGLPNPDAPPMELDYAHLFHSSAVMFAVTDGAGRVISANPAWERTLGHPVGQLLGSAIGQLIHPADREAARLAVQECFRTGRPARLVNRALAADGTYRELEWQASVVGEWVYSAAVDVSEREQERRSLRRGDQRHQSLFQLTTQGVIYLDGEGLLVDANPAALEILGLTAEQMRGRTAAMPGWDAIHEDGSPFPAEERPSSVALRTGREVSGVVLGVPKGEDVRWMRIRAVPELDPATGAVTEVSVTFDDITESRAAGARIEAQNESLRQAMAEQTQQRATLDDMMVALNHHAIVSVTDLSGRITAFNDNFVAISKYSPQELLGKTHRLINSGYHPKGFFKQMWQTIAAGHTWQGEICNRSKDGELYWVLSTIQPFRDAQGRVYQYVSIRTDITRQKAAEHAAAEASRAKSRFLATMSHEIRTPLTAIIGLSHLADEAGLDASVAAALAQIRASGEHLLAMLNDVLDFSKIEVSELVLRSDAIDPAAVVEQAAAMHRTTAQSRGLALAVDIDPSVPAAVLGDELRLRQVLLNLISNAVKCTQVGTVRVSVAVPSDWSGRSAQAHGEGLKPVRFVVSDTGSGIPAEDLQRIFDPFVQADSGYTRTVGGTGLGLPISAHLVTLMGGRLDVDSQVGLGSTFQFTLPMKVVAAGLVQAAHRPAAVPERLSGRVLLVEDNLVNRTIAAQMLARAGLSVDTATDGAQAVAYFQAGEPAADVVLMDIHMPVLDGWEATRRIRALRSGARIPIIALTANALTGDREACLAAGMNDHLAKPFDPAGLTEILARWLPGPGRGARRPAGVAPATAAGSALRPPALDRLAGLRSVGEDVDLYCELLEIFAADTPPRLPELAEAVSAGDQQRIRAIAHFLKGSALALGATGLANSAIKLEGLANNNCADQATAAQMLTDANEVLRAIPGLVRELRGMSVPSLEPELDALAELDACLRASEWVPPELVARVRDQLRAARTRPEQVAELLGAVERYDFAAAAQALAEVRGAAAGGSR